MKNITLLCMVILFFSNLNSNLCESENFTLQRAGMLQGYCNSINHSFSNDFELNVFLGYDFTNDSISSEQFILSTGFYDLNDLNVNVEDGMIEYSRVFLQNYPNPFNPTTTIYFSIPKESTVELYIYNIKGQKIKTLVSNQLTVGQHSIIWNGDDETGNLISSGIYYYKLNVNGNTEAVKKCLLLK